MGANVSFAGGGAFDGDPSAGGTFSNFDTAARSGGGMWGPLFRFVWGMPLGTMDAGCIISTGKATDMATKLNPGGGVIVDATTTDFGAAGAAGDSTSVSFSFIPMFPIVVVPFLFGSEEFEEWEFSPFNDTCSVKVNGIERAVYPGGQPINVNNSAMGLYGGRTIGSSVGVGWDGVVPRNLILFVVPGTTCTVSLNVADVRDGLYDSGVMIGQISSVAGLPTTGTGPGSLYAFLAARLPYDSPAEINAMIAAYIAVVSVDTRLFVGDAQGAAGGGTGDGQRDGDLGPDGPTDPGSQDDGEIFQAYVRTKAYQPGGDLAHQGEVAHTAQPLLIARPQTSIALYLDLLRDLQRETQQSHVDLTPVAAERRVIRKFESAATGGATEIQFQLGDAAPVTSQWDLYLFSIELTHGGMR